MKAMLAPLVLLAGCSNAQLERANRDLTVIEAAAHTVCEARALRHKQAPILSAAVDTALPIYAEVSDASCAIIMAIPGPVLFTIYPATEPVEK